MPRGIDPKPAGFVEWLTGSMKTNEKDIGYLEQSRTNSPWIKVLWQNGWGDTVGEQPTQYRWNYADNELEIRGYPSVDGASYSTVAFTVDMSFLPLLTSQVVILHDVTVGGNFHLARFAVNVTTGEVIITEVSVGAANATSVMYDVKVVPDSDQIAAGDGQRIITIPIDLNGWLLVRAEGYVTTVSSAGTPTIQLRNVTDAVDMLSTRITIDVSEFDSYTAVTPSVINLAYDDVATGDRLAVDIDVSGTGTKGVGVHLYFDAP